MSLSMLGNIVGRLLLAAVIGSSVAAQDAQPAPEKSDPAEAALAVPQVLRPLPPDYRDDQRRFQGIPSVTRSSGGRLWATWYAGGAGEGPENYVLLATSGDDGRTWSRPLLAVDPDGNGPLRAFDPSMWTDPLGGVWLFWAQGASWWDGRAGVWAMKCEDPDRADSAWSRPRRLFDGIMMCRPMADSRGRWLYPAAIWQRKPNSAAPYAQDLGEKIGANVMVSTDQGATYQWLGQGKAPAKDAAFDEHMLLERKDGGFSMFLRTKYGIGTADSRDGGRTWSDVRPSGWPHPSARFFIHRLQSGNLLLVKHGGMDQRTGRSHLTAHLSDDDGRTWKHSLLLDERKGVSYPDGVQDQNGRVYIIYDYNRTRDKQILMARFSEADIIAGKVDEAPSAWSRIVVNQATGSRPKKKYTVNQHADGAALMTGPPAKVEGLGEMDRIAKFQQGAKLFHDRSYQLEEAPEAFVGRSFLRSGIDGTTKFVCRRAGVIYVLTPQRNRNKDSVVKQLETQGFQLARHPEVMMFGGSPANLCTVYQKRLMADEEVSMGKWGVAVW